MTTLKRIVDVNSTDSFSLLKKLSKIKKSKILFIKQ